MAVASSISAVAGIIMYVGGVAGGVKFGVDIGDGTVVTSIRRGANGGDNGSMGGGCS